MALQIHATRRCLRNLMTNSIDRRRISSFSYSVVTLKILAAGWSIVSVELEPWRGFVNEMTQTFWAVTFFIQSRQWKFCDIFHFPVKFRIIQGFISVLIDDESERKWRLKDPKKFWKMISFPASFSSVSKLLISDSEVEYKISQLEKHFTRSFLIHFGSKFFSLPNRSHKNQLETPQKAEESISTWCPFHQNLTILRRRKHFFSIRCLFTIWLHWNGGRF